MGKAGREEKAWRVWSGMELECSGISPAISHHPGARQGEVGVVAGR